MTQHAISKSSATTCVQANVYHLIVIECVLSDFFKQFLDLGQLRVVHEQRVSRIAFCAQHLLNGELGVAETISGGAAQYHALRHVVAV